MSNNNRSTFNYPTLSYISYVLCCAFSLLATPIVANSAETYPPKLTLTSDLSSLKKDQGTRIRWSASNATSCQAIGGWTTKTGTVDKHWVRSISNTTTYQMTCRGEGGSVTKAVTISSALDDNEKPQQSAPKLTLTSDLSSLKKDQGTRIRWSASNATSCQAIGGWTTKTGTVDKHWVRSISNTTTYQMTCRGEGGSVTKAVTISSALDDNEKPQQSAPKLTLTSDLSSLKKDQGTRIRWSASNATSCQAIGGWTTKTGTVDKHWVRSISNTTTYQMTCRGEGGSVTKAVTISSALDDNEKPQQSAPKLTLTSDLSSLKKDQGTRIRWSASNATSCQAIGGWTTKTGTVDKHWVRSISNTTTYQMTCRGEGGSVTKAVTISSALDDNEKPQQSAPKLTLTSDLSSLKKDQGTRIRWSASNATSCQAIGGWTTKTGTVDKHWVRSISNTTTYQMTCRGEGGSVTKAVTISSALDDNEKPQQSAPKLTLTSDLSSLKKDQGTRIRWSASNATSCQAIGGWTTKTGTVDKHWVRSISNTTTYQMTCRGEGGSVTKAVTISSTLDDNEKPQQSAPTLTLTSDLISIDANGSTTIRWASNNATRCGAQNNWSSKTDTTGKQYVTSIENTTSFTMTCIGDGGSVSKSVLVTVNDPTPSTGSANLSWSAPATNQDGSQLNDLASYKIYYGSSQSNLNNVEKIDAGLTSYVIENLSPGTHYFSMTAIDTQGNESTRSNIAAKVVN